MKKYISNNELSEILASYDLKDLIFDYYKSVEPDTDIYIFHDKNNRQYCLIASDYLDETEMPCEFIFEYYKDDSAYFRAIKRFSYVPEATKAAVGYVDDGYFRTMASTGDVCMMYEVEDLSVHMNEKRDSSSLCRELK